MEGQPVLPVDGGKNNGLAITSLILGIVGWAFALLLLCLNVIVTMVTIGTLGIGSFLYICTAVAGCIVPLLWLGSIITGHLASKKIKETGEKGAGLAKAGLIMSYIGLGLTILSACVIGILAIAGVPVLESLTYPTYY